MILIMENSYAQATGVNPHADITIRQIEDGSWVLKGSMEELLKHALFCYNSLPPSQKTARRAARRAIQRIVVEDPEFYELHKNDIPAW